MSCFELLNPFTPSSIVSNPKDFFGRDSEMQMLDRSLRQGSFIIQGPIGIGKSSLLSRVLLYMDGYNSGNDSKIVICVSHKDIKTVDDAARLLLEELCDFDEKKRKIIITLPKLISFESEKAYNYFSEGRYLSALLKIIEDKKFINDVDETNYIIFAIDECDKSPKPIAKLIRQILTKTQLRGLTKIRFILSGISPFYEELLTEDEGLNRFIYRTINLGKLQKLEARELLESKISLVVKDARENKYPLEIDPDIIERVLSLANGHPHLIQLLGSCLIEHENSNNDGIINAYDLVNALKEICYENRAVIYNDLMNNLKLQGYYDALIKFISISRYTFPTSVNKNLALKKFEPEELLWLLKNNIITDYSKDNYELVDEFLRVRIILDEDASEANSLNIIGYALLNSDSKYDADPTFYDMLEDDTI